MATNNVKIRILSGILALQTVAWVVLTVISMAAMKPGWGGADFVKWAANPDLVYILNYINAVALTSLVLVFFSYLYAEVKSGYENISLAGLLFVPVYGVLNLICYSLQISVVPDMARSALSDPAGMPLAIQLVQANRDSLAGFLNGMAYALLGMPSIIFGFILFKNKKKPSGAMLLLNGVLCISGITGYVAGNHVISMGIMAGGLVFLLSLILMAAGE